MEAQSHNKPPSFRAPEASKFFADFAAEIIALGQRLIVFKRYLNHHTLKERDGLF